MEDRESVQGYPFNTVVLSILFDSSGAEITHYTFTLTLTHGENPNIHKYFLI